MELLPARATFCKGVGSLPREASPSQLLAYFRPELPQAWNNFLHEAAGGVALIDLGLWVLSDVGRYEKERPAICRETEGQKDRAPIDRFYLQALRHYDKSGPKPAGLASLVLFSPDSVLYWETTTNTY